MKNFHESVEYDLNQNEHFNNHYQLSKHIYSNDTYYLYSIRQKDNSRKLFLEATKSPVLNRRDIVDHWQTKDYLYYITEC